MSERHEDDLEVGEAIGSEIVSRWLSAPGAQLEDPHGFVYSLGELVADAMAPLRAERDRLLERERHFASVLGVADGGQYRNDWEASIRRIMAERDRALGEVAGLREALELALRGECPVCGWPSEHAPGCEAAQALSSSPLAEKAGKVLGAALALRALCEPGLALRANGQTALGELIRWVDALRAELAYVRGLGHRAVAREGPPPDPRGALQVTRPRLRTPLQVLAAIRLLEHQLGMPPTIEELRVWLKVGSTRTVLRYLRHLEEEGKITRWPGARGIRINREGTET